MSTPPPDDPSDLPRPSGPAPDADAPGTPLRAILTGLAIDIGGSVMVRIVAGTLYVQNLLTSGLSEEQVNATLAQARMPAQSGFAVFAMIGGALCSVAAGFSCARIVQRDEFRIGGLMGVILALLTLLAGGDADDDLMTLVMASTLACNLLGVKYGAQANARRRARKSAEVPEDVRPS